MTKESITQEKSSWVRKSVPKESSQETISQPPLVVLQNQVGNRTVQRLLAQRSGDGPTELDDDTVTRINSARGGGQSLDTTVQQKMGGAMGSDFSGVRVHTGSESNQLNEQLGAKAFTTGQDVFFRDGEYNPSSSGGQELLAHELTHVVQQGSGAVPSSGKMAVNDSGDQFEQEADSVAQAITSGAAAPGVQRQEMPEEEVQAKLVQREEMPEEEEVQAKLVQREEMPEEELQAKRIQRQEGEEEEMAQMQEMPEEEEALQAKLVQREEMPEEEMVEG